MKGDEAVAQMKADEYMRTHSRDGYGLGSPQYPDNREGRRKLARTWRGHRSWDRYAADEALLARAIRREQRKAARS